ncbi:uncharacterized protein E5676_scaffold1371G00490 [Cucumis melo var. makuwa]|uniref:Ubiquitin-like protease family profile domain-containing protein n=1 Tax=Cucumis melo var. makuwa TaxID=1194695 RepID=A0A5D3BNU4_CUCMM|nr:uncharacterized protein E6C27_scaffold578G00620 [Cucumis melo var. makuwa]TYK00700.1 uncharacterized protein E5676_scaffold1371G00490 [Cucumis melo var. makuwa]
MRRTFYLRMKNSKGGGIEEKSKFEVEEKSKRVEVESIEKPKENEKKGKEMVQIIKAEFDVFKRDSIKMPTEREVICESTSTLSIALKSILRYAEKDIIDLCNMNEVKTFTLVANMMYLYSSVLGSKENVQLMVSKANQVVLAPFNPRGHWALLAINAYEDIMFYLDSQRTTSKSTTRYVIDIVHYKLGAPSVDTIS